MPSLVLLRHGQSVWNKEDLFTGWTDVDLSEQGIQEAQAAGRKMTAEGLDFDLCFTSVLKRAMKTLNLALAQMDRHRLPGGALHGNSLRGLVKHLDQISDQDIPAFEIPTGTPLVYDLDDRLKPKSRRFLAD